MSSAGWEDLERAQLAGKTWNDLSWLERPRTSSAGWEDLE